MAQSPRLQYAKLANHEFARRRFPTIASFKTRKYEILDSAFGSIGTSRFFNQRKILEWNPYAQAIPVYNSVENTTPKRNELLGAVGLAEAVHELLHILSLEPVYTGAEIDLTPDEFVDYSLIIEAFCYWYGELKYTRDAELCYPNAKRIFNRDCSASVPIFHPDWVLKKEGVRSHIEAFDLYHQGFRGRETSLLGFKSEHGRMLTSIIYGFFASNRVPTKRFLRRLKKSGLLGRWQNDVFLKFEGCVLFETDGLAPREVLSDPLVIISVLSRLAKSVSDRHFDFKKRQALVQLRRRLQTRASFTLSDLAVVEEGRLVDSNGRPITATRHTQLKDGLQATRDRIFEALCDYQASTKLAIGRRGIEAVDRLSAKVYDRQDLWVVRRHRIATRTGRGLWWTEPVRFHQDFSREDFFEHDFIYQ